MITLHVINKKKNVIAYLNNSVDNVEKNSWLYHSPWHAYSKMNTVFLYEDTGYIDNEETMFYLQCLWHQSAEKRKKKKFEFVQLLRGFGVRSWCTTLVVYSDPNVSATASNNTSIPLIPGQTRDTCFGSYKSRPSVSKGRSSISLLYMYIHNASLIQTFVYTYIIVYKSTL